MAATHQSSLMERLAELVDGDQLIAPARVEIQGRQPAIEVTPPSAEAAAAVLRAAHEAGAAVTPFGGGSQQSIGLAPERLDVVLRTERLQRVIEWEPADLTASIEAGLTLATVQQKLAGEGQQLPIDAPQPDRATLGGLVATNTSGPRRWLHGGWRDLIIGMHMALGDGTSIKSGGRVVKNVQGYDLGKLFCGSLGSLGLITRVNLKLTPLPAVRRLLCVRGSIERLDLYLKEVGASTARVAAIDVLDAAAATACGLGGDSAAGLVLVEGRRAVVDAQSALLQRLGTVDGLHCDAIEGGALEPVWRAWVDLGRTGDLGEWEALLTVSSLPDATARVMGTLAEGMVANELGGYCWSRAGNGVTYARLAATGAAPAEALAHAQALLLERWPATTLAAGGQRVRELSRPWGAEPEGLAVMQALKQRFDPSRTLQPGRFVGGI